ncbi:hypothetical protein NPIL_517811, partial [Nephila pilipes]
MVMISSASSHVPPRLLTEDFLLAANAKGIEENSRPTQFHIDHCQSAIWKNRA